MKSLLLTVACFAISSTACTTVGSVLIPFDPNRHGDAVSEWAPHDDVVEWWYVTGQLTDEEANLYLYQLTVFHSSRAPLEGWILDLAVSDYTTGLRIFEEYTRPFWSRDVRADGHSVSFAASSVAITAAERGTAMAMEVKGSGRNLSFDLSLTTEKPAVWHDLDGIFPMGREDDPKERSFYYSYTNMETAGMLTYTKGGEERQLRVTGLSWFDRQWGAFTETGWDWFSLRFFDGEEIMLFGFPETGFTGATYIRSNGNTEYFRGFTYQTAGWQQYRGKTFGLGWELDLPVKEGRYHVVPLYDRDFNPNVIHHYWEGLCAIYTYDYQLVGYCVTETTADAYN